MGINSLDRWLTTPPEVEVVHYCTVCGGEIYENSPFYAYKNMCFDDADCMITWLMDNGLCEHESNAQEDYYKFDDEFFDDEADLTIYIEENFEEVDV